MNPLGVHALVFVSGWSQDQAARAIDRAAASGYHYLEIPLIDPRAINVRATRKALKRAGVSPITSLELGMDTDISSGDPEVVSRGEALLMEALSVARDLGSPMLSGVLYSALGRYQAAASDTGRWNCIQVLRRLAERARASDMTIGIEPVNRYESNLINTGDDALRLIDIIGADNMVVHLDSYHMNIEEGAPGPLIQRLGDRLGYVHVNESHRGYLGTGSIDFAALFQALADHGYQGVITFEAYAAGIRDRGLNADLAVWRPLWDDPDDLARHARTFMETLIARGPGRSRQGSTLQASTLHASPPYGSIPPSADGGGALRPAASRPGPAGSITPSKTSARRSFGWARQSRS